MTAPHTPITAAEAAEWERLYSCDHACPAVNRLLAERKELLELLAKAECQLLDENGKYHSRAQRDELLAALEARQ